MSHKKELFWTASIRNCIVPHLRCILMSLAFNSWQFNISSCWLISGIFDLKSDILFLEMSSKYNFSSGWHFGSWYLEPLNKQEKKKKNRTSSFSCGKNLCKKVDTWLWNKESFNRLLFLCAISTPSSISGMDGSNSVLDDYIIFGLFVWFDFSVAFLVMFLKMK